MELKTEVKEEVDQITSIRTEFEKFKTHIQQHISNQGFSGGGSGETRVEFLDDVDRDTAKVNGKALVYDSSTGKWIFVEFTTDYGDACIKLTEELAELMYYPPEKGPPMTESVLICP